MTAIRGIELRLIRLPLVRPFRTSFGVDVPLLLTVWWVGLISRERRQRCISHSTSPLDSRHQNGRDMEGPARDT